MSYPNIKEVSQFFVALEKYWSVVPTKTDDGIEYLLSNSNRSVRVKWYKKTPEEFWFSMHEGDRCDLVDWTEMLDSEKKEDLFEYLKLVASRYLEKKTRITKKWLFFGAKKLQYLEGNKWHDLRSPI
ncbi:hypothetical protein [Arenicella xantha]|uniref:Uncharacterized protein n=1 Tax=Arenicella xantha TaxID=644221 RepID=A0A395JNB7_9GAMM|nr:hypothetical protein [Arenicella xantha]RBP49394.1 hypothetical protein DFR28_104325 [Arenicella xantha]